MSQKPKIKNYNITVEEDIELFQAYISALNWMIGKRSLSGIEIEVLSYFLYYNYKYSAIEDIEVRMELLFSINTKRKIRDQFNINTQKLEGYLNKLKKKGIIQNNRILEMFLYNPKENIPILFTFGLKKEQPIIKPNYEDQEEVNYKPLPYDYNEKDLEEEYEQD